MTIAMINFPHKHIDFDCVLLAFATLMTAAAGYWL